MKYLKIFVDFAKDIEGLSDAEGTEPEKHAARVNSHISDIFLRNADLLIAE